MKLRLNPSAAHTWTECTAQPHYILQTKDYLPPNDTEYNREGTVAHSVVEAVFKEDAAAYKVAGFKKEMGPHAEGFVKFCRELQGTGEKWWSERKVQLFYAPESHGYIDFSCFPSATELVIADYKYGQGVAVSAEENLQMAIYAVSLIQAECGIWNPYNTVTMAIYQPRVKQGDTITKWTISWGELQQFVEERVRLPAEDIRAKAVTLRFSPGPKVCQFCPAAGFCGLDEYTYTLNGKTVTVNVKPSFTYNGQRRAEALLDDTPLAPLRKGLPVKLPTPEQMQPDALATLVLREAEISKLLKDAKKYATAMISNGGSLPGIKMVQGRGGHRYWRNEDEVREILLQHLPREDVITENLVTPSQADQFEHDLPKDTWEMVKKLTAKPDGGPVLAAANDPRPAFGVNKAADWFDDESMTQEDWV